MLLLGRRLTFLCLLASCRAGSPTPTDGGPSSDVAAWPVFNGDGFQIQMPGLPAVSPTHRAESDAAGMEMRAVSYLSPDKKVQYGVVTFDFPTVAGPIAFGSPLYLTVHGRVVKGFNAKVLSDVAGTYYGVPGHQVELDRPAAGNAPARRITGRLVAQDQRLYFVSIIRDPGDSDAAAQRYLDTFRITGL